MSEGTGGAPSRALVLGGGGITGVAWELGVVHALQAAGLDLAAVDLVVGTSAGSIVGAGLTAGLDLETVLAGQLAAPGPAERSPDFDLEQLATAFLAAMQGTQDAEEIRARIGAMALATPGGGSEDEHIARIGSYLPVDAWPPQRLLITTVDAETGEFVVWDRSSGASLARVVTASCAVPGVWPPVTINGRRYMDGGVRTTTNVDLAEGHDVVLVLAPIAGPDLGSAGVEAAAEALRPRSKVLVVAPDEAALAAIGPNPLDIARRADAARAGQRQGQAMASAVKDLWAG